MLDSLAGNGLREVALGIESGSERMLRLIDKRIDPFMTRTAVRRLTERGINVKGYFILGLPTESRKEIDATVRLVHELWSLTDPLAGQFRASVFEYRPYPGTPDWHRLMATGHYTPTNFSTTAPLTSPIMGSTRQCVTATSSTSRSICNSVTPRWTTCVPNSWL
jgi:anaerobic magnesium-protoporphyrin IX monomethyl ester cyclase